LTHGPVASLGWQVVEESQTRYALDRRDGDAKLIEIGPRFLARFVRMLGVRHDESVGVGGFRVVDDFVKANRNGDTLLAIDVLLGVVLAQMNASSFGPLSAISWPQALSALAMMRLRVFASPRTGPVMT